MREQDKRYCILVVDFGTSNVHINMVDVQTGEILFATSRKYDIVSEQDGYAEIDPETLWKASMEGVGCVIQGMDMDIVLSGISFSYFGDNLLLMDESMKPLSNLVLGFDVRGAEEVAEIEHGLKDRTFAQIVGCKCETMCTGAKILWFRKNEPELFKKCTHFFTNQQYILWKLGLRPVNDITMASRKCMVDLSTRTWSEEIMQVVGISADQLGEIVNTGEIIGTIEQYGDVILPAPVPVVVGGHDCDCGMIGVGVFDENQPVVADIAGTFDHIGYEAKGIINLGASEDSENVCSYSGPIPDSCSCFGAFPTSGALMEWFMREIAGGTTPEYFRNLWEQTKLDGSVSLQCIPFVGTKNGCFKQICLTHTRASMFEALVEALTFEARRVLEEITKEKPGGVHSVRIGGGLAHESRWLQLRANVFGCCVERMENIEISSLGAAVIAAVSLNMYPSIVAATKKMIRTETVFEPDPKLTPIYQAKYQRYLKETAELKGA